MNEKDSNINLSREVFVRQNWEDITLPKSIGLHFKKGNLRLMYNRRDRILTISCGILIVYCDLVTTLTEFINVIEQLKKDNKIK